MKIYLKAGIPIKDVLRTATGNAAKYLPIDKNGSLVIGGPATFLLLTEDPLENLDALSKIEVIFKNGVHTKPKSYKYQFNDTSFD